MPMIWYSGSPKVKSINQGTSSGKSGVRQPIYLPLIVLGVNDHLSFR